MTPTPVPEVAAPSMTQFWMLVGVVGVVAVLFIIGLLTGQVRLTSSKTRESVRRGVLTAEAVFSSPGKRAAIEYIRDEEHMVEFGQTCEGGDGDDEEELAPFQRGGEDDDAPD